MNDTRTVVSPALFAATIIKVLICGANGLNKELRERPNYLLGPFVGIGGVDDVVPRVWKVNVEIDPAWAEQAQEEGIAVIVGDSPSTPWPNDTFAFVYTSPSHDKGGAMRWGEDYRRLHAEVWRRTVRALTPGGVIVLNIKDNSPGDTLEEVCKWHLRELQSLGLELVVQKTIPPHEVQNTASTNVRGTRGPRTERTFLLRKPEFVME